MSDIEKPVALVTGASRGIGAATAKALAAAGYHVLLTARTEGGLEATESAIHDAGGSATIAPFDITDGDALDRLAQAVGGRWGKLDALVLNAAILGDLMPVSHVEPKDFEKLFRTNVTANYRLIRAFDLLLRASPDARVVAVTSSVATAPRAYWGAYAASKAALANLVETYGLEVAAISKVRTHVYNPGATATAMRAKAYPGEDPAALKTPEAAAAEIAGLIRA
ncbi:SDR family NAD(P)-dependent oxidoreductase [Sphingosinicella microcystinivorans]|uniref:SDR family NAD(P)-dependent oxidoreductase n=1 Tax=Sphingosinicella microcystinivorans TaxID=335406 RepID=UPI0022F4025A|nr:SDR family NAD(P)-dependent oxidoreductase [Sphingosinicella microcystinivorans]WBX83243.1 SDR family NAD(P)-dependent oxidoreductase [Sphingosinicella microcystinivorans]